MSAKHLGSSIDDFLKEEGILDQAQAQAVKEVVAWQQCEKGKEMTVDTEIRHVTKPGENLFLELGFTPDEAKRLRLRLANRSMTRGC